MSKESGQVTVVIPERGQRLRPGRRGQRWTDLGCVVMDRTSYITGTK